MKKRVLALIGVLLLTIGMMGCSYTECEMCRERKICKEYPFFSLKVNVCKACAEETWSYGRE